MLLHHPVLDRFIGYSNNNNSNNNNNNNQVKRCNQPDWLNKEIRDAVHTRNLFKKVANFSEDKLWRNKIVKMIHIDNRYIDIMDI